MSRSRIRLIAIAVMLAIVMAAVPVFTGCGKVAEFADPVAENILLSMNRGYYAGFSRDFDDVMKRELSEAAFPEFLSAINGSVGNYVEGSMKIKGVNIENDLTTASYTVDFESMEGVTMDVVFKKINDEMKVVGLWFQ
jgi:major membrane immunogen (membrane-anchored lipoprotein)